MAMKKMSLEKKHNLTGWLFLLPASLLIFVFCFYPMVQALILSFKSGMGNTEHWVAIANYTRILKDKTFQQCLFNTVFYFVIQVPIMLLLSLILAQLLNLKSGYTVDYGMLMLGVLICTLPTAIIFLCLQKSFANGITGAVK